MTKLDMTQSYSNFIDRHGLVPAIIEDGMSVRITEAELVEIVVEQDHRAIAVIKSPLVKGRKISAVIAALEATGANAVIDEDFARDVEEGISGSFFRSATPDTVYEEKGLNRALERARVRYPQGDILVSCFDHWHKSLY